MNNSKPVFILAGNHSYYNRGCEAIIRGTVKILRNHFDEPRFLIFALYRNKEQFKQQRLKETDKLITHKRIYRPCKRYDFQWFLKNALTIVCPGMIKHITYKDLKPHLDEATAVLTVGGDNYSYEGGIPQSYIDLDDLVIAKGKPLVIWGASVGPFSENPAFEKYIIEHFRKVHIFARETETIEYLAAQGLTENVYRVADPAFLMEATEPKQERDKLEIEQGAIGLNLSPLMKRFVANGNVKQWTVTSADIISKILQKTDRRIYLIPHVTEMPKNDDYVFLRNVLSIIPEKKHRVVLIPPIFNAPETKWIISKMSVFAGARMHSTIASLSSYIPTLSLAYSIKAKGLNKDIYGHTNYCISPDELTPDIAAEKINEILHESKNIRKHLEQRIPEFEDLAINSGKILHEILKKTSP